MRGEGTGEGSGGEEMKTITLDRVFASSLICGIARSFGITVFNKVPIHKRLFFQSVHMVQNHTC